jgi:transposase-like protein
MGKKVVCPKCHSKNIVSIKDLGRYYCNKCSTTFSVLTDTIFENSRLPLTDWFMIIGLMLNAKKGISAKQIMRDAEITYKSAWYAAMRVRCAMIDNCHIELKNIIEMDESYVGGKPRKGKVPANEPTLFKIELEAKRGRGTNKIPVVGIVERKGNIVLKVIEKLTSRNLLAMLKQNVKIDSAFLLTDEFKTYKAMDKVIDHLVIEHKKHYSKNGINTNTIEGFWAILKNSIRGQYVALSKKYLPLYLVQAQYIFNHRNYRGNLFEKFLKEALNHEKPMEYYKPIAPVKSIVYHRYKTK